MYPLRILAILYLYPSPDLFLLVPLFVSQGLDDVGLDPFPLEEKNALALAIVTTELGNDLSAVSFSFLFLVLSNGPRRKASLLVQMLLLQCLALLLLTP